MLCFFPGKSTIALLLESFYHLDSGKITIDGFDVKNLDLKWLRGDLIGFINQVGRLHSIWCDESAPCPDERRELLIDEGNRRNLIISDFCCGKAMVAYTMPQQRKQEESKRLRGERDQIKLIDLRFERGQVVGFRKARRRQDVPQLHVLGMNDGVWDRVFEVGSETWKGCE